MPHHHHGPHHHHPRHRPHRLHHHLERDLDVLSELTNRGRILDTDRLISVTEELSMTEVSEYLKEKVLPEYGNLAAAGAIELANGHFGAKAQQRFRDLIERSREGKTALIFPLPPHVHEPFIYEQMRPTILLPNGHPLPPHLHDIDVPLVANTRTCRRAISTGAFSIIVFEMHRSNDCAVIDPEVGDVLQGGVLPGDIEMWAQLRPDRHPEDVEIDLPNRKINFI